MVQVVLPNTKIKNLPFYLATEEYVAKYLDNRDYFFMWQVNPTVIIGRNQLIDTEVNISFCKKNNISIFRRKSGGGSVYSDYKNIMCSYITNRKGVNGTFNYYLDKMTDILLSLGIPAEKNGRNDILINGRKVSGNSFYKSGGKSIVHGTMLFDTDLEPLVKSLTPSNDKLVSKGIASVRERVTKLSEYTNLSIEEFKNYILQKLCSGTVQLGNNALEAIEVIEREYYTNNFIYNNNPPYTIKNCTRTANAGSIEARIELKNNIIRNIHLYGDFFTGSEIENTILSKLIGTEYTLKALNRVLSGYVVEKHIIGLKKSELISLIIS
ncbi:MAG TPA: lipoate--protein ligase [Bacteroidaceae bacterium]|nr:lipoate--protein ligase [Bacteroidaceae bacterium]